MNSRNALNLIGLLAVNFLFIVSLATSSAQTLTVNDGSGSGQYVAGERVTVTADPPPPEQKFTGWSGDTQILANPSLSTTTATMPSIDVTISATYAETADRQTSIATATVSPSPTASPSPSPTPGETCSITVTLLRITRTPLTPGANLGNEWSFSFDTFVDGDHERKRFPAAAGTTIPLPPNAAGDVEFELFSGRLPKGPTYDIRILMVAHEDDTRDAAGRLTGLPPHWLAMTGRLKSFGSRTGPALSLGRSNVKSL